MIIEEINKDKLSCHDRLIKNYDCDKLRQLAFDFTSTYVNYYPPISKECHSIYKKKDGSLVVRITKYRPILDSQHRISPGYINGYGHELVDIYEQFKFDI